MTEPTHHMRRDVEVQIDMLITRTMLHMGLDEIQDARSMLRQVLASTWTHGFVTGAELTVDDVETVRNPYVETDIA